MRVQDGNLKFTVGTARNIVFETIGTKTSGHVFINDVNLDEKLARVSDNYFCLLKMIAPL